MASDKSWYEENLIRSSTWDKIWPNKTCFFLAMAAQRGAKSSCRKSRSVGSIDDVAWPVRCIIAGNSTEIFFGKRYASNMQDLLPPLRRFNMRIKWMWDLRCVQDEAENAVQVRGFELRP